MDSDHERLEVYHVALEFVVLADTWAKHLPRGNGSLADQLLRASTSITFNVAEGAGEFSEKDKARFFRIARRSATECAAILDVCDRTGHLSQEQHAHGRTLLVRVVSMLVKMIKSLEMRRQRHGKGSRVR